MWRKWNYYNGNRGPSIGHPTLIETTMEEGYLETIPEVDSLKSKRSSVSTILPELPFRSMPQMQTVSQQHREPLWSQPSPTIPDYYVPEDQIPCSNQSSNVSPLSSPPQSNPDTSIEEMPVSPIDSELPFGTRAQLSSHDYRSRIPQRVVSGTSKNIEVVDQEREETKWDVYSGEPTKDEMGQPSAVRPGTQLLEHQYPQLKERTKQILAGLKEREREREREREAANKPSWGRQPPPVAAADPLDHVVRREPWKGASGRTTLVDPVQNNPSARTGPIHHPQRNISRMKQEDVTTRAESPTYTLRSVASEESIKPVAPLKIATKSRNPSPQSSNESPSPPFYDAIHSAPPVYQHPRSLQSPFSSPGQVRNMDIWAPPASARADSPPNDPFPDTPRTPTPPAIYQTSTPLKVQHMPNEHDVSRFSWTTYATSVTDSPGNMARIIREESPPPPIPQMPALHIKKRPVTSAYVESPYMRREAHPSPASMVTRKPVGGKPRPLSGMASSQLSLSKTLPQIPPELEATNKIANLEAQLNALAMRKHNTTRIIRDLNENLRKNAIVYDLWKRKDVSDRIINHEEELQNIANEERDVQIALHRAQKKRDVEDNYEIPTGLWIRRVTN